MCVDFCLQHQAALSCSRDVHDAIRDDEDGYWTKQERAVISMESQPYVIKIVIMIILIIRIEGTAHTNANYNPEAMRKK